MRFQILRIDVVEFLPRPLDDQILGESVQEPLNLEGKFTMEQEVYRGAIRMS